MCRRAVGVFPTRSSSSTHPLSTMVEIWASNGANSGEKGSGSQASPDTRAVRLG